MSWLLNPFKLQCSKDYKHSSVPKRNFDNGFSFAFGSQPFTRFTQFWTTKKGQNFLMITPEKKFAQKSISRIFTHAFPICVNVEQKLSKNFKILKKFQNFQKISKGPAAHRYSKTIVKISFWYRRMFVIFRTLKVKRIK